jgi:hypothetical protein
MRPGLFTAWQIYQICSARSGKRSQMGGAQGDKGGSPDCLLVHAASVVQIAACVISHFCCERAEIQSGVGRKSSETHTSELITGAPGAARNRPLSPQLSHLPAGYRMCTATGPWAHQSRWPSACAARPPSAAMSTCDTTRPADSRIPRARPPLLVAFSFLHLK